MRKPPVYSCREPFLYSSGKKTANCSTFQLGNSILYRNLFLFVLQLELSKSCLTTVSFQPQFSECSLVNCNRMLSICWMWIHNQLQMDQCLVDSKSYRIQILWISFFKTRQTIHDTDATWWISVRVVSFLLSIWQRAANCKHVLYHS